MQYNPRGRTRTREHPKRLEWHPVARGRSQSGTQLRNPETLLNRGTFGPCVPDLRYTTARLVLFRRPLYDFVMARTLAPNSGNVFKDLGIREPDVELAKADLAVRIQRLVEHRRLTPDEAAALLEVPKSELPALFQGRLATCSLDQLVRMLTWLGDDVEILIRPRLQRTKRGALRVLQAAAVEKPDDFEPVRHGHAKRLLPTAVTAGSDSSDEKTAIAHTPKREHETTGS